ncbi:MAG: histone deacetylase family protein [Haloferacaceae archaeon]
MRFGYSETCLAHDPGDRHPESPARLRAIRQVLAKRHGVEYVEADPASEEVVTAVHRPDYVDEIRAFCEDGGGKWGRDTVACERTWDAALAAAGQARWAAERALDGDDGRETPFAIGRPPGHHAVADDAMGFCFLNHAAVATRCVLDEGAADRVAIFDWDVHHGNGTQDIFYDDPDVCYASIHENGLYPGTGEVEETGTDAAAGTTLNVPLAAGAGDPDYLLAVDELLVPLFDRFDPDLVLVSAGFDAHRHDPISRMRLSTEGYALLTDRLRSLAGRSDAGLGFVLEGGYGLETLSESVAMVHETFDGRKPVPADGDPTDRTTDIVARVADVHGFDDD